MLQQAFPKCQKKINSTKVNGYESFFKKLSGFILWIGSNCLKLVPRNS